MAKLETTVYSAYGDVKSFDGRQPAPVVKEKARQQLEREIIRLKEHLSEVDNWMVRTHRGESPVRSYEQMRGIK